MNPTNTVSACCPRHKDNCAIGVGKWLCCDDCPNNPIPTNPPTEHTISLCRSCYCITKTIKAKCGKCKADKVEPTVEKWVEQLQSLAPFTYSRVEPFIRKLLTQSVQEAKAEREGED